MTVLIDFTSLDLMDALDLAILIEFEAWERYTTFNKQIGHRYPRDAASFFSQMAENEKKHGQQLQEKRQSLFGDKPIRVNPDMIFDVEAPDVGSVRSNMSPFKALHVALNSEEKAFNFYQDALEHVADTDVRELFEELREEEVEHIDLVKKAIAALPPNSDVDLDNEDDI